MPKLTMGPVGPVLLQNGDRRIPVPLPAEVCARYEEIIRLTQAQTITPQMAEERMRREVLPHAKIPVHDYRPARDILVFYPEKRIMSGRPLQGIGR